MTTTNTSTKENQMDLTANDIRTITATAAKASGDPDLADAITSIDDEHMAEALKEHLAKITDELATGREQAKTYKPGGTYS
jgi:hypothetical protein